MGPNSPRWIPVLAADHSVGPTASTGIGQVVQALRPTRAGGHGAAWEALDAERAQITEWAQNDLSVVSHNQCLFNPVISVGEV